jgi:hypothetical protein
LGESTQILTAEGIENFLEIVRFFWHFGQDVFAAENAEVAEVLDADCAGYAVFFTTKAAKNHEDF